MFKQRLIACSLATIAVGLAASTSHAEDCAADLLKAQSGQSWIYDVAYKGMGAQAERRLEQLDDGWMMNQSMSLLIVSLNEESRMVLSGNQLVTQSYLKEQKGLGARTTKISVDSASGQVTTQYKGETQSYAVELQPTDLLGHTLQIQIDRQCNQAGSPVEYNILSRSGIKNYSYSAQGEETINSPWGQLTAERWQREADSVRDTLWLVPSQNYALVRVEHEEKGELSSLQLRELK